VLWALLLLALLAPGKSPQAQAVDARSGKIVLAMATEPPSLNTLQSTDSESFFVLTHVMEGLTQYDVNNKLVPGVASRWRMDEGGATFWLRKDARWSDGKPVTAQQFVYAWREAVDPKNGAPYASILYPIKNARGINTGGLAKAQLGVKALDDHTLQVTFEQPCPYFLGLTAFATYYPRREDIVEQFGARFAAESYTMVYNGPYQLDKWVHGASLRMTKNPHYWDARRLKINTIEIPFMTSSAAASLNLYRDGAVAFTSLDAESLKEAVVQGYPVRRFRNGIISYIQYNFREGRASVNHDLRRAMQLVFDSATLVNKVIAMPGNRPLNALFPSTLRGVSDAFQEEFPPPLPEQNLVLAREHIALAKESFGGALPPLTLLVSEAPVSVIIGEYLQNMFKQALGLDIRLDKQIFKQRIAKMQSGDFDLVLAGWGPDFDDPMTYADLFASWNENNRGRYANESFDHWIAVAQQSTDATQRMQAMDKLQMILHQDVGILPLFEGASVYLQHPELRGVGRAIFGGDPNYKFAWIEAGAAP
jgi:oligopeptide transport system substrate-binding protein